MLPVTLKGYVPDKGTLPFLKQDDGVGTEPSCQITFWQQPTASACISGGSEPATKSLSPTAGPQVPSTAAHCPSDAFLTTSSYSHRMLALEIYTVHKLISTLSDCLRAHLGGRS